MSFDMKLMFVFHVGMMVMFMLGSGLTIETELLVAGGLALVMTTIIVLRRRATRWRWSGASPGQWLMATGTLAAMVLFGLVASFNFSPAEPRALPWFLALVGIGFFNLLSSLGLTHTTETAFRASLAPPASILTTAETSSLIEPRRGGWRSMVRTLYTVLFLGVWLIGLAFFAAYGLAMRDGAAAPTAEAVIPLIDHGRTVYLPLWQGELVYRLRAAMFIGVPSVMALGFLLHLGLGVKIFDNLPTWRRDEL
ncbi:MAG: hypothetical protein HY859_00200 [Caulobacterales bacterium]|nr:hypothetical protein [Caulobacterales bacterium]